MDEFECSCLLDFVGENWSAFLEFMLERDYDEAQCEDFAAKLEKQSGRS